MIGYIPHIFIFSVFRDSETADSNNKNHASVIKYLLEQGYEPIELFGRYNGIDEKSILIEGSKNSQVVKDMASLYQQESYLESHNDRMTELVFMKTGERKKIGTLQAVTQAEALANQNYSYNPNTQTYYMVK